MRLSRESHSLDRRDSKPAVVPLTLRYFTTAFDAEPRLAVVVILADESAAPITAVDDGSDLTDRTEPRDTHDRP